MASAKAVENINVSAQKIYNVVTDFEKYPEFLQEMTDAKVEESANGVTKVHFNINLLKPVSYTLRIEETNPPFELNWTLLESDVFKVNTGGWKLKALEDDVTEATYFLECDFKVFVPNMIVNKIISAQLPKMLHCFKERAESL